MCILPYVVHSVLVGGWRKLPNANERDDIQNLVKWSMEQINEAGGLKLSQICGAESQVVAGSNYRISFLLENQDKSKVLFCEVKIFEQKWLNNKNLSNSSCNPKPSCPED